MEMTLYVVCGMILNFLHEFGLQLAIVIVVVSLFGGFIARLSGGRFWKGVRVAFLSAVVGALLTLFFLAGSGVHWG